MTRAIPRSSALIVCSCAALLAVAACRNSSSRREPPPSRDDGGGGLSAAEVLAARARRDGDGTSPTTPPSGEGGGDLDFEAIRERMGAKSDSWNLGAIPAEKIDYEVEQRLGAATARAVISSYGALAPDAKVSRYVGLVGTLLSQHSERPEIAYRFVVLESDVVNAFAAPDGWIFVTTGLLEFIEDEAELAFVLAHEIVHVEEKHGLEQWVNSLLDRMKRSFGAEAARLRGEEASELEEEMEKRMHDLSDLAVAGKGREAEGEADRLGLRLMVAAGYDSRGAVSFLERFVERFGAESDQVPIFRSHDAPGARLQVARRFVDGRNPGGARLAARFREWTSAG